MDKNPKSRGAAERFSVYVDGITVEAAVAGGSTRADVVWDHMKRFIAIVPPEQYEAELAKRDAERAARTPATTEAAPAAAA